MNSLKLALEQLELQMQQLAPRVIRQRLFPQLDGCCPISHVDTNVTMLNHINVLVTIPLKVALTVQRKGRSLHLTCWYKIGTLPVATLNSDVYSDDVKMDARQIAFFLLKARQNMHVLGQLVRGYRPSRINPTLVRSHLVTAGAGNEAELDGVADPYQPSIN